MKLMVAAKRIGDKWEGAVVVDNKFQRAIVTDKLEGIVLRGVASLLMNNYPEGTDVLVDVTVEEAKDGPVKA